MRNQDTMIRELTPSNLCVTYAQHMLFRLVHSTRFLTILFTALILSMANIGIAWADAQFDNVYIYYSLDGGTTETGYECNWSYGDFTNGAVVTSSLVITKVYMKFRKYNGNICGGQLFYWDGEDHYWGNGYWTWDWNCWEYGGNYDGSQIKNESFGLTLANSTDPSGNYTIYYYWQLWGSLASSDGCAHNWYMPNNSSKQALTYTILPPAVSSFAVTPKGAISGSGTSVDPYIIPYGGDLTLTMSGSQGHTDANSSAKYYNTSSGSSWTTQNYKTISNVTSSDAASVTIKMCYENNTTSSLKGAESSKTVYYKAAKGVSVYKFQTKSSGLGTGNVCAAASTEYPMTTSNSLSELSGGTLTAYATTVNHLKYNENSFKFSDGASGWLILGLENKIKAGDVIRYINSGSSSGKVAIRTAKSTTDNQIILPGNGTTTMQTVVITDAQATAFASLNTVYMVRTNNTSYISYFEILRPYAVTLDANTNGGKVGGADKDTLYYAQSEFQLLPYAAKSGYRFKGWFEASSGGDAVSNPYTATASTTLYAQWEDCPTSGSVYSFQVKDNLTTENFSETNPIDLNVGNYLTTLTGGLLVGNRGSSNNYITKVNGSGIRIANNGGYLKIDLDCETEAGDTIKTIVTNNNTAWLHDGTTRTQTMTIAKSANTSTYQKQVIPAALEGTSTLYMFRGSGSCDVLYFEIIRPTKYTISYNANGGSGSMSSHTVVKTTNQTLSSNTFTKTGYTFAGWHADVAVKVGGSTISAGDDIEDGVTLQDIQSDITLTAQWTCTDPSFDTDLSTTQVNYSIGDTPDDLEVAASASGADIDYQWYSNDENNYTTPTELDGETNATYTPSTSSTGTTYYFCKATNHTCSTTTSSSIAKIVVSDAVYSVTTVVSGGVGGSVDAEEDALEEDGTTTITASPATGYQVTNWAVSGTGASISPSGSSNSTTTTLTMGTANATVTVTFGLVDYNVTYSAPSNGSYTIKVGDGSASSATKTANYGNTITLAATPSSGYIFDHWTVTETSSGDAVSVSNANVSPATFTMPAAAVTVEATFKTTPNIYYYKDATHYSAGTYKNPEGNTASSGDNQNLTTPWKLCNACIAGVDSIVVTNGQYDGKGNHIDAYIKLATGGDQDSKNIIFGIANGYKASLISMKAGGYSANPTITLKDGATTKSKASGYATIGGVATTENNFKEIRWSNLASGVYVLTVGTKNTYISEIDVQTTPLNYTITLNNQSATSAGTTSIGVTYDANTNLSGTPAITVPTKTGYTFGGYYTEEDGEGTQIIAANGNVVASASDASYTYTDGSKNWKYVGNITLYAKWTADEYTITYRDRGDVAFTGTQEDAPTTHTYGTATTLKIPTREGYIFGGWFTASDCASGAVGTAASASLGATDYTADITLYALWLDYSFAPTETSGGISAGDTILTSAGGTMASLASGLEYNASGLKFAGGSSDGVSVRLNRMLQAGTKIVSIFYTGTTGARGLKMADKNGTVVDTYEVETNSTFTYTYTVTADDGLDGTNVFKLIRYNNVYLKSVIIYDGGALARTITYHSSTDDDYVVDGIADGSDLDDEHVPTDCAAADRVFVGWATEEVSVQQTEPTIVSTDGTLDDVTVNMDLYAVFASKNGGKVTGTHTLTEDFESYTATQSYGSTNLTFDNANGLLWKIDYGNVTTSGKDRFGESNTKNVLLSVNQNSANQLVTRAAVNDVMGISVLAGKATGKLKGVMYWGTNGSTFPNSKDLTIGSISGSYKNTETFSTPKNIYLRFKSVATTTLGSGDNLFLDSVVFTIADRAYYLTDYSSTCDKAASATVTWVGGDGAVYDEPSAPAVGGWVTFPEITRPNYQFDGWKATIEGDEKSHTYNAGEVFLVNHDVTFTAQWTRYIENVAGVSPITTGNGIAVRAIEVDSIVVNSESATTPTVTKTGADASLFTITVDAANKRVADGKTHFPYTVVYTPTSHNVINSITVSFTCDDIESNEITVRGRSLPEEFVIAVKKGDGTWVALPNTIVDNTNSVSPIEIVVDNTTTPTKAVYAPSTTAYKTDGRYAAGANVYGIRFTDGVLKDAKYNHLQVSSSAGTYYVWLSYTGSSTCQDWLLQSEDLSVYQLKVPSSGAGDKKLGIYNANKSIGYHGSPSNANIYLLPIETKAPIVESTISDWAQYGLGADLASSLDADEMTVKLGGTTANSTSLTGSDTRYDAAFDDEDIDFSGHSGDKLLLIWKKDDSAVGGSIVTIPSIKVADASTWSGFASTPTISDVIVINQAVTVNVANAKAKAVVIGESGSLTVEPTAGLVVATGARTWDGSAFGHTAKEDLVIQSSSAGTGAFIAGEASDNTEATVQLYTKARRDGGYVNQYIGIPFETMKSYNGFYGTYIYAFDVDLDKWSPTGSANFTMEGFAAYNLMRPEASATTLSMGDTLILPGTTSGKNKVLTLTRRGSDVSLSVGTENLFANSWTAPIDITAMQTSDFVGAEAVIYIFNAGTSTDQKNAGAAASDATSAGQWISMPVDAASYTGWTLTTIPAQQAFLINASGAVGDTHTLTLDYKKHVYDPAVASGATIQPLRAPKRTTNDEPEIVRLHVEGESGNADNLLLFERADFSYGFDNGWQGRKIEGKSFAPQLYTVSEDGNMSIDAVPDVESTLIGFKAGNMDEHYTFTFNYDGEDELFLIDTQTGTYTRVENDTTYEFDTYDTDYHTRFALTRHNSPQITTGIGNEANDGRTKAVKFINNDQLFILLNGVLYDATGRKVSE